MGEVRPGAGGAHGSVGAGRALGEGLGWAVWGENH